MIQTAVSPDGKYLAQLLPDGTCYVSDLFAATHVSCYSTFIILPQKVRFIVSHIEYIRWSPELIETPYNDGEEDRVLRNSTWLLLASPSRLFLLELHIPSSLGSHSLETRLIADIEFPSSHGKMTAVDFVFDHNSILIMFDIMPNAALLSLTNAQRNDLPNRKFASQQAYALSKNSRSVAVLTRDMHTDHVAVFQAGQLTRSFKLNMIDAQGILWSPDERPILCVWESAAHGLKAQFYTAMGHLLNQFDLVSQFSPEKNPSLDLSGIGIGVIAWSRQGSNRINTIFVAGHSSKHLVMRLQNSHSLSIEKTCLTKYPEILDSSSTTIWQQIDPSSYRKELRSWNVPANNSGEITLISISADGQRVATVATDSANIALIWQFGCTQPISAIIFQKDIRHILWHPSHSAILAISITDRASHLHVWSGKDAVPYTAAIPKLQDISSGKWQFKWLTQIRDGEKCHPLMVSSTRHFDIGFLELDGNRSFFKSLFPSQIAPSSDESTLFF